MSTGKYGVLATNEQVPVVGRKMLIPIENVVVNETQPRSAMSPEALEGLKSDLRKFGLIHPLKVYCDNHDYNKDTQHMYPNQTVILKSGHRRLQALKELGKTEVEVCIESNPHLSELRSISANHFTEKIHPLDKHVEIESLLNTPLVNDNGHFVYSGEGDERELRYFSLEDIAKYKGVSLKTIHKWYSYRDIPKEIRALVVTMGERSESKLRKIKNIWNAIDSTTLSDNDKIEKALVEVGLFLNGDKVDIADTPQIDSKAVNNTKTANYLYRRNGEFQVRLGALKKLKGDKESLEDFIKAAEKAILEAKSLL